MMEDKSNSFPPQSDEPINGRRSPVFSDKQSGYLDSSQPMSKVAPAQTSSAREDLPYPVPGGPPGPKYSRFRKEPIGTDGENEEPGLPSLASIQRRSTLRRIFSIIGVILVLAVLAFVGVFVYNKFFVADDGVYIAEQNMTAVENNNQAVDLSGDMDNDGLPDKWEVEHGLDPTNPNDAQQDPDLDRLKNIDEYYYKTDPRNSDTDGDGFYDGVEVEGGYNPAGEGKLKKEDAAGAKNYTKLAGNWQGIITGSVYSSPDLYLVLKSDGSLTGRFSFSSFSKDILASGRMDNEISGTYTYDRSNNQLQADVYVKATYQKEVGQYNIIFTGLVNSEANQITGTWTGGPKVVLPWLKQDRGNFQIQKTQ